jgi:hypothetical protein
MRKRVLQNQTIRKAAYNAPSPMPSWTIRLGLPAGGSAGFRASIWSDIDRPFRTEIEGEGSNREGEDFGGFALRFCETK